MTHHATTSAGGHGHPPADPGRGSADRLLRRGAMAAGLVAFALLILWLAAEDQVIEVIPGEVMRSGQLDGGELRDVIERSRLRTVVSLTGSGPADDWVGAERELCAAMGVRHVTLPFSLDTWPGRVQVELAVKLLDTAERPLLFHCLRGVDRSGWASAVALLLADAPVERALQQMSRRTGHLCDPNACPLHRFFASYADHLAATGRGESAAAFREWVASTYCPAPYNAQLEPLGEFPRSAAAGETLRLNVRVTNRGADAWRMTDSRAEGVRLGARVVGPFSEPPADPIAVFRLPNGPAVDIARAGLESGVMLPGSRRDFELRLRAPRRPGRYLLQLDMVDERVHWFSDLGWTGIIRELEVVPGE
jgi:hypothetical protein